MPAGLVEDDDGVSSFLDGLGDLCQMQAHGFRITAGQDQARSLTFSRTDGTEEEGRAGALVTRCRGPAATFGPPAGDFVLLANPRFILEPNLYFLIAGNGGGNLRQLGGEVFLKAA